MPEALSKGTATRPVRAGNMGLWMFRMCFLPC